ncbi:MAG: hypothetical protein E2O85_02700 [Bacteroidetes bacterium]|nr:MAG: hypothetical protein E2O85_02700 [Bacteroidota bacterium]
MEFSTVFFILMISVIVFSFIAWNTKVKNDLKREQIRAETGSQSLGTSELKGMIQDAMTDAIIPLEERLELIESHMRRLPEGTTEETKSSSEGPPGDES